ncbi:MAG TPA: hypothetical protein VF510_08345 [Ktedonobacterales bacterium]
METPKSPVLFYIAIAVAVVALSLCIYNAIPNIYHVTVPAFAEPTKVHEKYVGLFGGLAALGVIVALITWPKSREK